MSTPIQKLPNGSVAWDKDPDDLYLVTGTDRNGKRFKQTSSNWNYIRCINIWRGTLWLLRGGKRYKIKSYYN